MISEELFESKTLEDKPAPRTKSGAGNPEVTKMAWDLLSKDGASSVDDSDTYAAVEEAVDYILENLDNLEEGAIDTLIKKLTSRLKKNPGDKAAKAALKKARAKRKSSLPKRSQFAPQGTAMRSGNLYGYN